MRLSLRTEACELIFLGQAIRPKKLPITRFVPVGWFGDNRFCPVLLVPVWHLYSHVKMFAYTCSNMYPILVSPGTSSSIQGIRTHVCAFSYIFLCSFVRSVSLCHTECISSHSSYLCFIKSKAYYFLEIVSLFPSRFLSPTRTMCMCVCVCWWKVGTTGTLVSLFISHLLACSAINNNNNNNLPFLFDDWRHPAAVARFISTRSRVVLFCGMRHVTAHMWRHNLAIHPSTHQWKKIPHPRLATLVNRHRLSMDCQFGPIIV